MWIYGIVQLFFNVFLFVGRNIVCGFSVLICHTPVVESDTRDLRLQLFADGFCNGIKVYLNAAHSSCAEPQCGSQLSAYDEFAIFDSKFTLYSAANTS